MPIIGPMRLGPPLSSSSRRNNHYCKAATWDSVYLQGISDMEGWQSFTARLDRYAWVNLHAYNKHGTFEVRLHNATLDGEKVCNWIKATYPLYRRRAE